MSNTDYTELHRLLVNHMTLDEVKTLCFYLEIDHDTWGDAGKPFLLRELISMMDKRDQIGLLCHKIGMMRSDLMSEIEHSGLLHSGQKNYLDVVADQFRPPPSIDHALRDPNRIYIPLSCAESKQGTPLDAMTYIKNVHDNRHAVLIVGDYGTGKSFLAQKLFLDNAAQYKKELKGRIPILFSLRQHITRGSDSIIKEITEHLQAFRLIDRSTNSRDTQAEVRSQLQAGKLLCILDGYDEIPFISLRIDPAQDLRDLIECLAIGDNRVVITSRPGILATLLSTSNYASIPNLGIGYVIPWDASTTWPAYIYECTRIKIDSEANLNAFKNHVLSLTALSELTTTPLYCQMLVETRQDILGKDMINQAGLYQAYTERYFRNVRQRSPIQSRFDKAEEEISYKKDCLAATAVGMLEEHTLRLTSEEIFDKLQDHAQNFDDALLKEFTKLDILIYSLLVPDGNQTYSFSHKSFYEFFAALKIYKELTESDDNAAILSQELLSNEIVAFVANLLEAHPIRQKLEEAFSNLNPVHVEPLDKLSQFTYRDADIFKRNLALVMLELNNELANISLEGLNFRSYRFASNTPSKVRRLINVKFDRCEMGNAILTNVDLSGSLFRSAKMQGCNLNGTTLHHADLSEAHLQDISCLKTRFAGATFAGVRLNKHDAAQIQYAILLEQNEHSKVVDQVWVDNAVKQLSLIL